MNTTVLLTKSKKKAKSLWEILLVLFNLTGLLNVLFMMVNKTFKLWTEWLVNKMLEKEHKANKHHLSIFLKVVFVISGVSFALYLGSLINGVIVLQQNFDYMNWKTQRSLLKLDASWSKKLHNNNYLTSTVFNLIKTNKLNVYPSWID